MTLFEKATYAVATGMALLIIGLVIAYHWAGQIPSKPKAVAANAVFLWAPHVGFPGPRRGSWLSCSEEPGYNRCKLSNVDGNTEYDGEFIPYGEKGPISSDQLKIDPEKTEDNKVWIGSALVPLVFLQNGEILIPASKYQEGSHLLKQLKPTT